MQALIWHTLVWMTELAWQQGACVFRCVASCCALFYFYRKRDGILFIIAIIGFLIACPGIAFALFWLFTCPYVIGAIVAFVVISVIVICATESRHEEKSASDDVLPQEKGDWYIHYLSQPQEEQDENDEGELHKEM